MPPSKREELTNDAYLQADPVFSEPGLTVLTAYWPSQVAAKIDRYTGSSGKATTYDITDAAAYLDRYMEQKDMTEISEKTIRGWSAHYQWQINSDALDNLAKVLEEKYSKKIERGD
jgi:hypothetical protein